MIQNLLQERRLLVKVTALKACLSVTYIVYLFLEAMPLTLFPAAAGGGAVEASSNGFGSTAYTEWG